MQQLPAYKMNSPLLTPKSKHHLPSIFLIIPCKKTKDQELMDSSAHHFLATSSLILIEFLIMLSLYPSPSQAARPLPDNSITSSMPSTNSSELFVRNACNSTTYPDLCISSLSSYSSSINSSTMLLAHTALSISLDGARSASTSMKSMSAAGGGMSPREAGAMRDCMENVGDSIDELKDSLSEMGNLRVGKDMRFQMNSIQTWVSAALTNDYSCMDGFGGKPMDGSVKTAVRERVVIVAHLTSNALALIASLVSSTSHSSTVAP